MEGAKLTSEPHLYTYRVEVQRVVDGDTLDVDVDVGFRMHRHGVRLRLWGIDTPETRTRDLAEKERGKAAKEYVLNRIAEVVSTGGEIRITSHGIDNFGRSLATVYLFGPDGIWRNLNEEIISDGHAEPYQP